MTKDEKRKVAIILCVLVVSGANPYAIIAIIVWWLS